MSRPPFSKHHCASRPLRPQRTCGAATAPASPAGPQQRRRRAPGCRRLRAPPDRPARPPWSTHRPAGAAAEDTEGSGPAVTAPSSPLPGFRALGPWGGAGGHVVGRGRVWPELRVLGGEGRSAADVSSSLPAPPPGPARVSAPGWPAGPLGRASALSSWAAGARGATPSPSAFPPHAPVPSAILEQLARTCKDELARGPALLRGPRACFGPCGPPLGCWSRPCLSREAAGSFVPSLSLLVKSLESSASSQMLACSRVAGGSKGNLSRGRRKNLRLDFWLGR